MTAETLVISNPPHTERLNLATAAPLLELTPPELERKAEYSVPEIWLAERDTQARGYGRALSLAGLRVAVVAAQALVAVPEGSIVTGFRFDEGGLELDVGGDTVPLPYSERLLGIVSSDREGRVAPRLEVFALHGGRVDRFSFEQRTTSMRGVVEAERRIGVVGNVDTLANTCVQRFSKLRLDRRLQHVHLRQRVKLPTALTEKRRGYSFATPALEELLESLRPGAGSMSQLELSARLAFLTYVGDRP